VRIVELPEADAYRQLEGLCTLLIDAVEAGASVNFLADLKHSDAEAFWEGAMEGIPRGRTHLFAALEGSQLLGAVLLYPAWQPNQPHRADVAKLLVLRSARRQGVASRLMDALEARALELGRTLLTLDTVTGSGAEPFYQGRGYKRAGIIPNYALMPDGSPCDTSVYYKQLG
jgi:GNAT superfamily N-acetyltransferase